MKLKLPIPEINLGHSKHTLSLKMASAVMKNISKQHPSSFDLKSSEQCLKDIDALTSTLTQQVELTAEAIKALHGYPHSHNDQALVKQCEALQTETALAREIDSGVVLPDLQDTAIILSGLQEALEFEKATLTKKRGNVLTKIKAAFVKNLAKAKDYSHLEWTDWKSYIPKGAVDKALFKCELGKPTLNPKDEVGSPNRNASVLQIQLKNYLEIQALASAKRAADARLKTRAAKLDDIEKSLNSKLEEN